MIRLDKRIVDLENVGSRSRARRVIDEGKVTVNGEVVRDSGMMVPDDAVVAVEWNKAGTARKKVEAKRGLTDAGLVILFEDERLLALNKPVGLLTDTATKAQARSEDSLRKRARAYLKAKGADAFVVHRIDRDTSGMVLIAKDEGASENLRAQFRAQTPTRVYDVVVHGRVVDDEAEWVDVMAWDRRNRVQRPVPDDHPDAFRASAHMRVVERYATSTRLEVSLVSGRRNQIRLQCMLRNHPLIGERLYIHDDWHRPAEPSLERQALHGRRLEVFHPSGSGRQRFDAPWPKDFKTLVRSLSRDQARRS